MLVGYARVSTQDQNLELQRDALTKAGCDRIFTEVIGGSRSERTGLQEALNILRTGDTLVVWRLDRLGRSLKHLIDIVNQLREMDVGFRSLQESIDTTTSGGKLIFHMFGALAEFERDVIRERTQAGLRAARARGRQGGRPRALDDTKLAMVRAMYEERKLLPDEICKAMGISRATLYRSVAKTPEEPNGEK
ncbi:MAG: recombinase family protein [Desulfuromonadales bacterium]|nr:recombinase family protein [Desulfuromonadales bacterium]